MAEYDNDYATCEAAYATLRIFHPDLDPDAISAALGFQPTDAHRRGEVLNPEGRWPVIAKQGAWFLGTEGVIQSRDIRRHLDYLLDRLQPKSEAVKALQEEGCQMDIFCYWLWTGQGGP